MNNELDKEIENLRKKQKNKNLATSLLLTGVETLIVSNGVRTIKNAVDEHKRIKFACENDDALLDPRFKVIGYDDPDVALKKSKRKTFTTISTTVASTLLKSTAVYYADYVCKEVNKISTNKEISTLIASSKKKEKRNDSNE